MVQSVIVYCSNNEAIINCTPCSFAQTPGSEIEPAEAGTPFTFIQRDGLEPQPFTTTTQSCPVVKLAG
ncbi:MAG: hypothetical protein IPP34_15505 [Bacteroidetes bacterium]|nr:hypothetical protein [Bacteroidota bacterium]